MTLEIEGAVGPPSVPGEPQWIEPFFRPRAGADPLGQQTLTTDRIIGRLVPGVLALTERARYYSFYSWLLWRYVEQRRAESPEALSRYIKEREFELAIAVRLCPRNCGLGPMGGRKVTPRFVDSSDKYARRESIDSPYGGYGLYYGTSMNQMGLTARRGTLLGDEPIAIDILRPEVHARDLARGFAEAVEDTQYVRTYMDGAGPIPRDVLEEFSERACLCRLDTFAVERAAIRRVFFEAVGSQDPNEPERRRRSFALFLERASADRWPSYNDDEYRNSIWRALRAGVGLGTDYRATLSAWAALAGANYLHDGVTLLWSDGCRRLRAIEPSGGYGREDLEMRMNDFAVGSVHLDSGSVVARPEERTSDFLGRLEVLLPAEDDLPAMWRAAVTQRTALVGLALILTVLTRLPDDDADAAWRSIADIDGGWQDGLARLARKVAVHLGSGPTLGETAAFLMRRLVLRPHVANAASKLPDFTFLFRWELGRLQFFHHYDPEFLRPGNIRAWTLAQLSRDLGYCDLLPDRLQLTADGQTFVREAFGA